MAERVTEAPLIGLLCPSNNHRDCVYYMILCNLPILARTEQSK